MARKAQEAVLSDCTHVPTHNDRDVDQQHDRSAVEELGDSE